MSGSSPLQCRRVHAQGVTTARMCGLPLVESANAAAETDGNSRMQFSHSTGRRGGASTRCLGQAFGDPVDGG